MVPVAVGGEQSRTGNARLLEHGGQRLELVREHGRVDRAAPRRPRGRAVARRPRRSAETATTTSSWTATTRTAPGSALDEELDGLAQVRDLGVGLLLAGLERLLVAVDPDDRDLLLQAGLDVVVVARGDVDPALLGADAALALVEVRRVGLVGADLLGGDDEVEVGREVAPRLARGACRRCSRSARPRAFFELLQRRVGLLERAPALDGVGQEARARGLELPVDVLGDADRGAAQDLGVELVGARPRSRAGLRGRADR